MQKFGLNGVVEITLRHGCSSINLLPILKTPFGKNTCEGLTLAVQM